MYLKDCTCPSCNFIYMMAERCSANVYLHNARDPKEIGWEMKMLWVIGHFLTWPRFIIKIEVIYALSQTWVLNIENFIFQELSNRIRAGSLLFTECDYPLYFRLLFEIFGYNLSTKRWKYMQKGRYLTIWAVGFIESLKVLINKIL
jgi:hypothetical protein